MKTQQPLTFCIVIAIVSHVAGLWIGFGNGQRAMLASFGENNKSYAVGYYRGLNDADGVATQRD